MTIPEYLQNINRRFITGISREHTYRGDLQTLLESMATGVQVTNEPARIACGAPDYVLTRKDVPVGYIEAKDLGVDLNGKHLKEQFDRYKAGLSNLIFTDYLVSIFIKMAHGLPVLLLRLSFTANWLHNQKTLIVLPRLFKTLPPPLPKPLNRLLSWPK